MVKRYTGEELHGFMFPDYNAKARRWVDGCDYDRLLDVMKDQLELATQFLRDRSADGVMDEDDEGLLRQCETTLEWAASQSDAVTSGEVNGG